MSNDFVYTIEADSDRESVVSDQASIAGEEEEAMLTQMGVR
jgi:hypothetical protein